MRCRKCMVLEEFQGTSNWGSCWGRIQLKRLPVPASLPKSELVWSGETSNHQKLVPTFPWIDNYLMVTKQDFLENRSVNITKQDIPKWLVVYLMLLGSRCPHRYLILEENGRWIDDDDDFIFSPPLFFNIDLNIFCFYMTIWCIRSLYLYMISSFFKNKLNNM